MHNLQVVEIKGQRVLLTRQLAEAYGTERQIISNNYTRNKKRYVNGKHVIILEGEELKEFKASHQIDDNLKFAHTLYLWTEKGALLHAKSLNTDKAWQVYDYLVDFYFRAKREVVPVNVKTEPVKEQIPEKKKEELLIPAVKNPIRVFRELMELAEEKEIKVQSEHLKGYKSMLKNDRIAIRDDLSMNEVIFELAYELSHAIIHSNCGNMLESEKWREYHLRAIASAFMLIEALSIKVAWGKG